MTIPLSEQLISLVESATKLQDEKDLLYSQLTACQEELKQAQDGLLDLTLRNNEQAAQLTEMRKTIDQNKAEFEDRERSLLSTQFSQAQQIRNLKAEWFDTFSRSLKTLIDRPTAQIAVNKSLFDKLKLGLDSLKKSNGDSYEESTKEEYIMRFKRLLSEMKIESLPISGAALIEHLYEKFNGNNSEQTNTRRSLAVGFKTCLKALNLPIPQDLEDGICKFIEEDDFARHERKLENFGQSPPTERKSKESNESFDEKDDETSSTASDDIDGSDATDFSTEHIAELKVKASKGKIAKGCLLKGASLKYLTILMYQFLKDEYQIVLRPCEFRKAIVYDFSKDVDAENYLCLDTKVWTISKSKGKKEKVPRSFLISDEIIQEIKDFRAEYSFKIKYLFPNAKNEANDRKEYSKKLNGWGIYANNSRNIVCSKLLSKHRDALVEVENHAHQLGHSLTTEMRDYSKHM